MSENTLGQSHQPQLLRELRQKSLNLNLKIQKLSSQNKQKIQIKNKLQSQLNKLIDQTQVQAKKHRSLIVLLNQLQQTFHSEYLQQKQQKQNDQITSNLENSILRFLLIKQTENIKEGQKLSNFMKHILLDKNKGKAKQFIKKSNFIETQSQIIAKLKSQIYLLKNQNLQCRRKWYQLQQQSKNLQSHNKLLSIQNQRQKTQIKALYQQYLERINDAKTKIVSFNQTQKQSTINQHFVKQIAILQQKRVQIQEQSQNLQFHFQNLKEELERIQIQHKQLNGFFNQPGQQGTLANKMKKRIEQLRDVLLQSKKKNKNTRGVKLRKIVQSIKNKYEMLIQSNDYIELKTREQQNHGSFLQQKPIAEFFSKILQEKDQSLSVIRQQQSNLRQNIKELTIQKQLLSNQITHLQQNLSIQNWETKFVEDKNWSNMNSELQYKKFKSENNQQQEQLQFNQNYKIAKKNRFKQEQSKKWKQVGDFTFQKRKS